MFNLIPISLFIGALAGILYIVSGHLSEFDDNDNERKNEFGFNLKARFSQYVNQLPLDNIKSQSLSATQKLLHRFRLTLLKTDNHIMKLISKISQLDKIANVEKNIDDKSSDFWKNFDNNSAKQFTTPIAEPEIKVNFFVKNTAHLGETRPAAVGREVIKKTLKIKKSLK